MRPCGVNSSGSSLELLAVHDLEAGSDNAWKVYRSIAGSAFQAARSLLLSRCAASWGSEAWVMARTTQTRRAPASITSSRLSSEIPPMANHGLDLILPTRAFRAA